MATLFEAATGLDGEVDGAAEVHQVGIRLVLDFQLPLLFFFLILGTIVGLVFFIVAAFGFPKNLGLQLLVGVLVLLPFGVKFEDVEAILHFQLIIEADSVRDLIFFLYQIQLLFDCWIVFVPVLSHLKKNLNHILSPLVNVGFM